MCSVLILGVWEVGAGLPGARSRMRGSPRGPSDVGVLNKREAGDVVPAGWPGPRALTPPLAALRRPGARALGQVCWADARVPRRMGLGAPKLLGESLALG